MKKGNIVILISIILVLGILISSYLFLKPSSNKGVGNVPCSSEYWEALDKSDVTICESVSRTESQENPYYENHCRESCISAVAYVIGNTQLCELINDFNDIPHVDGWTDPRETGSVRDHCYIQLASKLFDTSLCNNVETDWARKNCFEIYGVDKMYKFYQNTQVSDESLVQRKPKLYDLKLVWEDKTDRYSNWNIVFYDLENENNPIQLDSISYESNCPDIYEDTVVWVDYREGSGIYSYNLIEKEETKISSDINRSSGCPSIFENKIIWKYGSREMNIADPLNPHYSSQSGIAIYDLLTQSEEVILNQDSPISEVLASNNYLVYMNQTGIYTYDYSTRKHKYITSPKIFIDFYTPNIAWIDGGDLFIYNIETEILKQITDDAYEKWQEIPTISASHLAWIQDDEPYKNLYSCHLNLCGINSTGIKQITNFSVDNFGEADNPYLYKNLLVFEKKEPNPNNPGETIIRVNMRSV